MYPVCAQAAFAGQIVLCYIKADIYLTYVNAFRIEINKKNYVLRS